jgi:hypothetical protein
MMRHFSTGAAGQRFEKKLCMCGQEGLYLFGEQGFFTSVSGGFRGEGIQMRRIYAAVAAAAALAVCGSSARAALIASDDFLTTASATAGNYLAGNLNTQAATNGTNGYFAGANAGNQAVGWNSGTAAFNAQTGGLTNPGLVNPPSVNDGSVAAAGNANDRLQLRDLANIAPPASSTYSFSALMRESVASYTGRTFVGLGPSRATGQNAIIPTTGIHVGFLNGAITLFYNNGGAALATQTLVASPTANATYLVDADYNATTGTITPFVYDPTGALVNNPGAQAVSATVNTATDLGAFDLFVSSNFNAGSPSAVTFDEFRFGTSRTDVLVPEPGALSLLGLGALGARRRRHRRLA